MGLFIALAMIGCKDAAKEKEAAAAKELEIQKEIKAIDSSIVEMAKIQDALKKGSEELDELLNDL